MVKLSDIDLPMIFKNRLLFSSGFYNNLRIAPEEMEKSFGLTDWGNQKNRSLYFSHSERDAQKWIGRIINPYVVEGKLYGDLEIHDADMALKLGPGRAPLGVSAEIKWPQQYSNPTDFTYRGFAMVPNPEVPEAMVNFSSNKEDKCNIAKIHTAYEENISEFSEELEEPNNSETVEDFACGHDKTKKDEMEDEEFATVTAMEEKRKNLKMSLSEFYAAPRDPPSSSALPIFDESHVRNALARFNQTKFLSENEKQKARKKIMYAAKKFNIKVSEDFSEKEELENEENNAEFSDDIVTSETARGSEIGDESDLMSAERGLDKNKMENNADVIVPEANEKETVVETVEVKEEATAEFSELNEKIEAISAKIASLEESFAKFSEVKEEVPAEEEVEEEAEEVEEEKEEVAIEEEAEEEVEETPAEDESKAEFSELASKIDKLADVIAKKEAAPMSTAEFGANVNKKENDVIDRLTKSLSE